MLLIQKIKNIKKKSFMALSDQDNPTLKFNSLIGIVCPDYPGVCPNGLDCRKYILMLILALNVKKTFEKILQLILSGLVLFYFEKTFDYYLL